MQVEGREIDTAFFLLHYLDSAEIGSQDMSWIHLASSISAATGQFLMLKQQLENAIRQAVSAKQEQYDIDVPVTVSPEVSQAGRLTEYHTF
jgi:hypothetical protein